MFTEKELDEISSSEAFIKDFNWVTESLLLARNGKDSNFDFAAYSRLSRFVESVMVSSIDWRHNQGIDLITKAAEISEFFSIRTELGHERERMKFRASLLYELCYKPSIIKTIISKSDFSTLIYDFFSRNGFFGLLQDKEFNSFSNISNFFEKFLAEDILALAKYEQGIESQKPNLISDIFVKLSGFISIGITTSEMLAFKKIIENRIELATKSNVDKELFGRLKGIKFPTELWTSQVEALNGGLLDGAYDSWGFAAPTGTGKTFLTRLLILKHLINEPNKKILYIVPSKALVYEVSATLQSIFSPLGHKVVAISPQIVNLSNDEEDELEAVSIIVLTPEKADLLVRISSTLFSDTSLLIVDEAHHIESGTRGFLLEMYLLRIKKLLNYKTRIVFLSAVAPNILDVVSWMGQHPKAVTSDSRSTRMKAGVYRYKVVDGKLQGWIDYYDKRSICIVENGVENSNRRGLIQLAEKLFVAGPVLTVAKGKKECEALAEEMKTWLETHSNLRVLTTEEQKEELYLRLDSRLEREMYSAVKLRELIKYRIVYHHAGLPPRVRMAIEDAIRNNLVDYVFATTTLAEGVNFPFSTVIVQSLALREAPEKGRPTRYSPITPRSFWNIAGRAGRPGFDKEGQVILFEKSLEFDKVDDPLESYLNSKLSSIKPVKSSLASSIKEIQKGIDKHEFTLEELDSIEIPKNVPKKVKGVVNLLRVSLSHAKTTNSIKQPSDIITDSFAAKDLTPTEMKLAVQIINRQDYLIENFLNQQNAITIELIAELGLSLETLTSMHEYVSLMPSEHILNLKKTFYGGAVNSNQAKYVIGPVAKRMSELEGGALGGFLSDTILYWIEGIPISSIKTKSDRAWKDKRLEDLIQVLYSRIQYLLPWGLFAFDKIIEQEAKNRGIPYDNDILSLAYLADAGVPNFNALRLVSIDIERVDATRLASLYQKKGGTALGVDILGWLKNEKTNVIETCLRGMDNRRLDTDIFKIISALR